MGKRQKPKSQRKQRRRRQNKKESRPGEEVLFIDIVQKESRPGEEVLSTDIMQEILVRCPVETLARFQCVCKQWGFITSQPCFQEDHRRRFAQSKPFVLLTRCEFPKRRRKKNVAKTNTLHLSVYTSEGKLVNKFSKTYRHECTYECGYVPIQSCRGLVCFGPMYCPNPIFVCNPSTMEIIALPPSRGVHQTIGFGYAASTKEFKVVRFFRHPLFDDTQFCCEVFTLGTSGWREARNPPPQYLPDFFACGAPFLHGALHMVANLGSDDDNKDLMIEAFDIEKEEYTKIPLPEHFHTLKRSPLEGVYLKEFEGSLCLTINFVFHLEIWCLRDYYNREWVKKYSIDLSPSSNDFCADPLVIMDDGNMMLNIWVNEDEALYYYNFHDKSLKKDTNMNCWGTLYVQSLLPIGSK